MKVVDIGESLPQKDGFVQCNIGSLSFSRIIAWEKMHMCKLCDWIMSNNGITCEKCRDKALGEAIDLGVHVDDYIDGLIVTKELAEDNQLPGYEVKLTVKKNKGPFAPGIQQSYTLKYDRSNCGYCDAGDEPKLRK